MKTRLKAAALSAFAMLVASHAHALAATREWRFEVSLDDRLIGEHRYVLREEGESRELTSEARFRVTILFFDAYRYDHRAHEWWSGNCLDRLKATTNVNGKRTAVAVEPTDSCVQTFAYWNPSILDARRLLNPQTGEYVDVEVTSMGDEVKAGLETQRFRLRSSGAAPLEIDLWYTPARDWVALESRTPEGRRLRYARKP
jgi:hypothetical protein